MGFADSKSFIVIPVTAVLIILILFPMITLINNSAPGVGGTIVQEIWVGVANIPETLTQPILSMTTVWKSASATVTNSTVVTQAAGAVAVVLGSPIGANNFSIGINAQVNPHDTISVVADDCPLGIYTGANFTNVDYNCLTSPIFTVHYTSVGIDNVTAYNDTTLELGIGTTSMNIPVVDIASGASTYLIDITAEYDTTENVSITVEGHPLGNITISGVNSWVGRNGSELEEPTDVIITSDGAGTNITNVSITYLGNIPTTSNITKTVITFTKFNAYTDYTVANAKITTDDSGTFMGTYTYGTYGDNTALIFLVGFIFVLIPVKYLIDNMEG